MSATLSCADADEAERADAAEAAPELPSFCLCMLLTDCPNRWRPRLQLEARMNLSAFTWYDLVGVLPGASADQIRREYDSKAGLLKPALLSGAPSKVIAAASRAQRMLDAAWTVLGDPASRRKYDEAAGVRRTGGGLSPPENVASQPGWADVGFVGGSPGAAALGVLLALTDWLAPDPHPSQRMAVPDVRGLFFSVGIELTGRLGLHLTAVRLTEQPMPVDGLIVGQQPQPPTKVRRDSELTVQVWHPPARSARASPSMSNLPGT